MTVGVRKQGKMRKTRLKTQENICFMPELKFLSS